MPKLEIATTNFTGGEFSPLLAGRTDIEKYNSSAKKLENVVVLKQGGATIRPPLQMIASTKFAVSQARLVRFVYSRTDAYQLEVGQNYIRVLRANGTLVETAPNVPYEIASPYTAAEAFELDFTQGEDTMIIAHGSHFPRRLRRFADARWVLDLAPLKPAPVAEVGNQAAVNITINNGAVGAGRTLAASGNFFLASDVNREITWGGGTALITAVGSAVSATATVTAEFFDLTGYPSINLGPVWTLLGSPMTTATASGKDPVGAAITVTLGVDGWRDDVGSLVELNGGLVRIIGVTSATVVDAVIVRELTSVVAAPADAWVVLRPIWSDTRGYPKTCAFYQQRLWFGNTTTYPQSMWGSRTALYFDFTPGTDDDSAVYKTAAATDEVNPLAYLCGAGTLVMLGYGAELEGKGGIEKPITQTNIQINAQSEWGCAPIRPMTVGKEIVFVERGGRAVRVLFPQQVDGYDSTDVSVFSEHLIADGIREISYERRPNSVVWVCTNSGKLLAFTYNREQNTLAWAGGSTDGVVESLSTIPTADADVTDAVVLRTINGTPTRRIERLNWKVGTGSLFGFYDGRVERTFGIPTTNATGFDALAGREVSVMGDAIYLGTKTVSGAGVITLDDPAVTVVAGLPYTARIVLPPPELGTGTGTSTGQAKSVNRVQVRVHDSVGMKINGAEVAFRAFDTDHTLDQAPDPVTGLLEMPEIGWDDDDGVDLELVQDQGQKWTVLSVVRTISVNAG